MNNIIENRNKELDTDFFGINEDASYADMVAAIDEYYCCGQLTKYIVVDFTKLREHLTVEEVMQLGHKMSALGKARKGGADILVVPTPLQYGLGSMYSAYISDIDPEAIETKVFRTREEAAMWIRQNK